LCCTRLLRLLRGGHDRGGRRDGERARRGTDHGRRCAWPGYRIAARAGDRIIDRFTGAVRGLGGGALRGRQHKTDVRNLDPPLLPREFEAGDAELLSPDTQAEDQRVKRQRHRDGDRHPAALRPSGCGVHRHRRLPRRLRHGRRRRLVVRNHRIQACSAATARCRLSGRTANPRPHPSERTCVPPSRACQCSFDTLIRHMSSIVPTAPRPRIEAFSPVVNCRRADHNCAPEGAAPWNRHGPWRVTRRAGAAGATLQRSEVQLAPAG